VILNLLKPQRRRHPASKNSGVYFIIPIIQDHHECPQKNTVLKQGNVVIWLLLSAFFLHGEAIKVGFIQNPPLSFETPEGKVTGFYPDLLNEIASKEGWQLQWVRGSWADSLSKLGDGELDLMTFVAPLEKRKALFSFNKNTAVRTWVQVFAPSSMELEDPLGMEGLRVAVVEKSMAGIGVRQLLESFGVSSTFIGVSAAPEVFKAVKEGRADVAVCNNITGFGFSQNTALIGTPIIFSPLSTQFATPKNKNLKLLNSIDLHLSKWKNERGSPLARLENQWLAQNRDHSIFPTWVLWSLLGLGLTAALWNFSLSKKVASRTKELDLEKAKLRYSEDKLIRAQILSHMGDFTCEYESGKVTWSEGMYRLLGYPTDDKIDFNFVSERIHHPQDRKAIDLWLEKGLEEGLRDFEPKSYRLLKKTGEVVHVLTHVSVSYEGKKPFRIFGTCQDISSQMTVASKLADREDHWKAVCENTPAFLITLNKDLEILFINRTIEGVEKDAIIGLPLYSLAPEDMHQRIKSHLLGVLKSGESCRYETHHDDPDGNRHYFESDAVRLQGQGEAHLLVISQDISERKKHESMMLDAKEMAEQANRTKSTFLANMSHELRTPMNAMLGMAQLLVETELNEEQKAMLERITKSGSSLTGILGDILDLASIEAGKVNLRNSEFTFKNLLSDMEDLFLPEANQKGIELKFNISPVVLDTSLVGDPIRIKQILTNLIGNAIKFTGSGFVRIESTGEKDGNRLRVNLRVIDSGIGISPDRQQTIFHSFEQADASTTRKYGGTGLGLAIVENLVQMMGGHIHLESQEEKGSTFSIDLAFPIENKAETAENLQPDPKPEDPSLNFSVLLAEDDADSRFLMEIYLKKLVSSYSVAKDGLEVMSHLEKNSFDLILMDLNMPNQDGLETTELIRADKKWDQMKIIGLTAHAFIEDRQRCLDVGMDEQLTKPVNLKKLKATMVKILSSS